MWVGRISHFTAALGPFVFPLLSAKYTCIPLVLQLTNWVQKHTGLTVFFIFICYLQLLKRDHQIEQKHKENKKTKKETRFWFTCRLFGAQICIHAYIHKYACTYNKVQIFCFNFLFSCLCTQLDIRLVAYKCLFFMFQLLNNSRSCLCF